jgi:hypothetical protein
VALHFSVQWSFTIAHSHYESIDLQAMSQGFAPCYDDAELDLIEEEVGPLAQVFGCKHGGGNHTQVVILILAISCALAPKVV